MANASAKGTTHENGIQILQSLPLCGDPIVRRHVRPDQRKPVSDNAEVLNHRGVASKFLRLPLELALIPPARCLKSRFHEVREIIDFCALGSARTEAVRRTDFLQSLRKGRNMRRHRSADQMGCDPARETRTDCIQREQGTGGQDGCSSSLCVIVRVFPVISISSRRSRPSSVRELSGWLVRCIYAYAAAERRAI